VPHPGSAQALADLLRGEADAMFDPAPSSMPHVRAGRLVPLASTGPTRAEALPDLPTVAEALPGYEGGSWFGLGAPRDTPAEVVARLNTAVNDGLGEAEVTEAPPLPEIVRSEKSCHRPLDATAAVCP
jgi:tripartite-type tricarboxylate transporter receptor subunit TctC